MSEVGLLEISKYFTKTGRWSKIVMFKERKVRTTWKRLDLPEGASVSYVDIRFGNSFDLMVFSHRGRDLSHSRSSASMLERGARTSTTFGGESNPRF